MKFIDIITICKWLLISSTLCIVLFTGTSVMATSPAGDVVGKVVVGYQGWWSCKGDGSPLNSWGHMNLEMWPDVREYTETFSGCPFQQAGVTEPAFTGTLGNGQPAKMFSSYSQQTMNTHFLWMQQNGIDCAALQIFSSYIRTGGTLLAFHTGVAQHMMSAAETYGRKFYIMYDVSSGDPFDVNWTNTMINTLHVTSSPAYAKQNGKPVVCFWGVGIPGRGVIADWVTKINWFKAQGCYVIAGAQQGWRSGTDMSCYNACDMVMPWMVGRTSTTPQPYFESWYKADLAYCTTHNLDYQADIYPGTGFYNSDPSWPKNKLPRMHGDFMWSQFAAAKNTGVQSIYISMFDEAQEATSIFKCAENASMVPAGKYFITLDADGVACSADFYLRLTNDGGKMVKGLAPYTTTHPTPHVVVASIAIPARPNGEPLTFSGNYPREIKVFDITGRCVRTEVLPDNRTVADVNGIHGVLRSEKIPAGIYLVRLQSSDVMRQVMGHIE